MASRVGMTRGSPHCGGSVPYSMVALRSLRYGGTRPSAATQTDMCSAANRRGTGPLVASRKLTPDSRATRDGGSCRRQARHSQRLELREGSVLAPRRRQSACTPHIVSNGKRAGVAGLPGEHSGHLFWQARQASATRHGVPAAAQNGTSRQLAPASSQPASQPTSTAGGAHPPPSGLFAAKKKRRRGMPWWAPQLAGSPPLISFF